MIFEARNLMKSFGGISAVRDVNFNLKEGEISSIIGPNGAGKTTLFNLITGKLKPDHGEVFFKGIEISQIKPYQLCNKKIGRSFQITNVFPKFTAYENIQVAILSTRNRCKNPFRRSESMFKEDTILILESLGMLNKKDIQAGYLAHGDQKLLDIGVALAGQPELLLLDEPTAGMSPQETRATTELVRKLAEERNLTVLLIEHDMNVVFSISQIIRVMHQGKLIAEGTPEEIRKNDHVQRVYLGDRV